MKMFGYCAALSLGLLAAFSAGCAVDAQDQDALDDAPASAEPARAEQSIPTVPLPTCSDFDIVEFKPHFCGPLPAGNCSRECVTTRHWAFLKQACVIDTTTCSAWDCPICF
jgi:hypothetical protein